MLLSSWEPGEHTWGEGAADAGGDRVAEGALHAAGQDGHDDAGDTAEALQARAARAGRSGHHGGHHGGHFGGVFRPEPEHVPNTAVCTNLAVNDR